MTDFHPEFGPAPTRVLLAMVHRRAHSERVSIPALSAELGRAPSTIHKHLQHLRTEELVSDDKRIQGALRPLVVAVPFQTADSPCVICEGEFPRDHVQCMRQWTQAFEWRRAVQRARRS
jgi:hypothetical protein